MQTDAESSQKMRVTLIGDSILDNKAYVNRTQPSVSQLLRKKAVDLNLDWTVTLCAIDGDVMAGVPRQLRTVPNDTDVLVLSIGGNDGLRYLRKLQSIGMHNPLNVVSLLNEAWTEFSQSYGDTLDKTIALGKKVIVCNIYYPCFSSWVQQKVSCAGLYVINKIIISEAAKRGLPVIDLATVFDQEQDYANPIEPGVPGADKLTANVIKIVREHRWDEGHRVYAERTYTIAAGSADELRDDEWSHEPRAHQLGRWSWEVAEQEAAAVAQAAAEADRSPLGDLPDLQDNDRFRTEL